MSSYQTFGKKELGMAISYLLVRVMAVFVVATLALYLVAVTPGVPYHISELFGGSPSLLQAALFALMVLIALGPPGLLGLQLIRDPSRWVWLFPLGMVLHAVLVFLVFRFATPIASVHDLVGLPTWPIPAELERLIRFLGVFFVVSFPISGGTALLYALTRSFEPLRFLWWLLYAVVFVGGGYWIVVSLSATDNVTVLLRGDAHPLSWVALSLWMLSVAFGASLLAERLAGVFTGTGAAVFALLLFLPLSFGLLFFAMEPRVLGPDSGLSALAFLLSGSRKDYVFSEAALFGRYAIAYAAVLVLLVFALYPVWLAYATRRFGRHTNFGAAKADEAAGDDAVRDAE